MPAQDERIRKHFDTDIAGTVTDQRPHGLVLLYAVGMVYSGEARKRVKVQAQITSGICVAPTVQAAGGNLVRRTGIFRQRKQGGPR
ncbi:hypothetical protein EMIT047CA2_50258 [Pseudomonas soli]